MKEIKKNVSVYLVASEKDVIVNDKGKESVKEDAKTYVTTTNRSAMEAAQLLLIFGVKTKIVKQIKTVTF